MEVFLRGLPPHLTDRSLQSQLEPVLDKLNIRLYSCEKYNRKPYGKITFLHKRDGLKFLSRHGEEDLPADPTRSLFSRQPKKRARLFLTNKDVLCSLSRHEPNPLALRAIEHEADQQRTQGSSTKKRSAVELSVNELSCGHYCYLDGRLTFISEWQHRALGSAKFGKRNLILKFGQLEVRVSFQSIIEMLWSEDGSVAVTLSSVPAFFGPSEISEILDASDSDSPPPDQRLRLPALDREHGRVSMYCLAYRFKVAQLQTQRGRDEFYASFQRVKETQFFNVTKYELPQKRPSDANLPPFSDAVTALKDELGGYTRNNSLPFGLLFLLQALVHNGYLHPATVSSLAKRLVSAFSEAKRRGEQQPVSVDAFKKLFQWINFPAPNIDDITQFEADGIMDYLESVEEDLRKGRAVREEFHNVPNLTRIFRATVTPTQITLHGPEPETKNRVLRKFPDHQDYFVRVQFCDEDGQDLAFRPEISLEKVYQRFKSVLAKGISVAGRVYGFLGFSHSSLRAHSMWLSAPFVFQGQMQFGPVIVSSLGDFLKIKSPARRAARIGQAFSETPYAVSLEETGIMASKMPDVTNGDRMFSDGVGTISQGAVDMVYQTLPESKGHPTCFQIRWGGAKGMLSLDTRLTGLEFRIRPSMDKFESDDIGNLEICDMASKPMPMVLNRQLIKIMEDMGAPSSWFLALQGKELHRLRLVTANVFNTASFLEAQLIGVSIRLHRLLTQAERMGVDYRRDAFLRSIVEAVVLKELRLLKYKARIPVSKGITLFGVMDETGYLDEGEVYVTYDTVEGRHSEPPGACPVIVTRSPALHPGDVQKAFNRIPPEGHALRALDNCIVFSQRGERDLPSQLSGGDLDGDLFSVIWDPDVVDCTETFPPADYPRVTPLEYDQPIETADMANFFIDFMKSDHVGVIATRHMILADRQPAGTRDRDCVKLAQLHSTAVDFSKSGRAVELSELPKCSRLRPDFLASGPSATIHDKSDIDLDEDIGNDDEDDEHGEEGPRHKFYKSDKILGKLHREVDERKIWAEDVRSGNLPRGAPFWDEFLAALNQRVRAIGDIEWRHRSEEARRIRLAYEDAIGGVMMDCSQHPTQPLKELEVVVGFILNRKGVQTSRQRDRSVKIRDEFERITTWILQQMRNPVTPPSGVTTDLDTLELCLACVNVACLSEFNQDMGGQYWSYRTAARNVRSFKIVAASALLRELDLLEGNKGQKWTKSTSY
ncbi:RNA dependent RNA polymerase-domain-containing protein [Diplogelasinospora grovesii]|uniref:RNA-dependent RNA polymerase n=1 Tax=Diplogelasinospora grovesii TaxID=303347 RepID=A0AAN6S0D2_9PEZI|nr:RNA dependent RNA polymerase-domain-containing protein [Diplogelasinospora grovesii]